MIDDATLLRRYAADKSGDAFAELVRRHLPLVYSAALRRLGGDTHRAEDIAQEVFCAVARNANRLSQHPTLTAWLYTATRNEVSNVIRAENRRRIREEKAHLMHETLFDTEKPADWSQLRPVLDTAMDRLSERDREAVLLRFFQAQPFAQIGAVLGLSEEAARKRVERALDKLRTALRPHGIASTSSALGTLLASHTLSAAPAALATTITGAAVAAGGATAVGVTAILAMTKLQAGIAAAVVLGSAAALITQQRTISALRDDHASAQQQVAKLSDENATLAKTRNEADAELTKLRAEMTALKTSRDTSQTAPLTGVRRQANIGDATVKPSADDAAAAETRVKLRRRYDPFLFKHGLTPAQADRFVELKIAIADAQADLQGAMQQAGAQGGTAAIEAMRSKLVKPMWDEIRQLLGEEGYKDYCDYEGMSAYRYGYVESLLPSFAAASAALSSQQADDLARAFASSTRSVRANPTDLGTRAVIDWDAVEARATAILTPAQLTVMQSYISTKKSTGR